MKYNYIKNFLFLLTSFLFWSCSEYLDLKPDKKLVEPQTIADLQAILDHPDLNKSPFAVAEYASDHIYVSKTSWESVPEDWRDTYIWNKISLNDLITWRPQYENVYKANLVISLIDDLPNHVYTKEQEDQVRGSAYYYRAQSFFGLAQIWCLPYNPNTSSSELGIPLRLTPDFNKSSTRPPLEDVYQQVLADLHFASTLLPRQSDHKTRPSKAAAFGMLSRTYLTMGNHEKAYLYADSCLQLHRDWIDFNTLDTLAAVPFDNLNPEMILFTINSSLISQSRGVEVSTDLLLTYEESDLRKKLFYGENGDGTFYFKGDYRGSTGISFCGLTTGEMFLNRAEGYARKGEVAAALADLNELRKHRFKAETFTPLVEMPNTDIVALVLAERKRELSFKGGLRWMDIRRLNQEPEHAITLRREWEGEVHTLSPGDRRYAFKIPELVIELSGIPQNEY